MKILVTGGLGYIGSHTMVELIKDGHQVIALDNLSNSKEDVIDKVESITGTRVKFYKADLLDMDGVEKVFSENEIDAVIHFAGLKAVGEGEANPLIYYRNNVTGTINLLEVMSKYKVKNIVFSSSATVYGVPKVNPITEDMDLNPANTYGRTKLVVEGILKAVYTSDNEWKITILRYFNPIGAHESGLIGENPAGIPNNLMPYITKVAKGQLENLRIFGSDYDTIDGTGVRDYIHVVDLAKGHIKSLEAQNRNKETGVFIYNLGTGRGTSVLELVNSFEKENDIKLNYVITDRRPGDIDIYYANPAKAEKELGWKAEKTVQDMCRDSWNFERKNV